MLVLLPDLISPLFDSFFGSAIYEHVLLSSISLEEVNSDLILQTRNTALLGGDSTDYGPKSRCASGSNSLEGVGLR